MKKYYFTITSILFFGLLSCSNEETKTQNQEALRPTVPSQPNTVTDIDGNVYRIVTIGNQSWTKTNLNVSHYRNGDPIPQVTDTAEWANLTTGAWCYYNNGQVNGPIYGKLYNWYAVNDPRGLAPIGWHVPSYVEWNALSTFLGGIFVANKMKATTGWTSYIGIINTNTSGFTGLPGGLRSGSSYDYNLLTNGSWWSSSEKDTSFSWGVGLDYDHSSFNSGYGNKKIGFSVRCIKD